MHPLILHDLAKLKMAEQLEYAERERRARLVAAASEGPRSIDFRSLVSRIKVRVHAGAGAVRNRTAASASS